MEEAEWMKKIPNETVCGFFYIFYLANAIIAVIAVIGVFVMLFTVKAPIGLKLFNGFNSLLMIAITVTMALFYYLMCDRALLSHKSGRGTSSHAGSLQRAWAY
jgi:hypothetical protein